MNATMQGSTAAISDSGMVPVSKSVDSKGTAVFMAARALFAEFGKVDNNPTRVILGFVSGGMTVGEYDQAEAQALSMAKATDDASGWKPAEGAKGRDKYGPKQSSMATQASQRRQVFGAAKLSLASIISVPDSGIVNPDTYPAFSVAVKKARDFLNEQGLTWDGKARADVAQAKENDQEFKARYRAEEQARKETPKEAGETYNEWEQRCKAIAKDVLNDMAVAEHKAKVDKVVKALMEKHGAEFCEDVLSALAEALGFEEEESPV